MEHTTKSTRIDTLLKVLKVLNIEIIWVDKSFLSLEFREKYRTIIQSRAAILQLA